MKAKGKLSGYGAIVHEISLARAAIYSGFVDCMTKDCGDHDCGACVKIVDDYLARLTKMVMKCKKETKVPLVDMGDMDEVFMSASAAKANINKRPKIAHLELEKTIKYALKIKEQLNDRQGIAGRD